MKWNKRGHALFALFFAASTGYAASSWLVTQGTNGLVYAGYANEGQTEAVNTVPDFSNAGYQGGGVAIPFIPAEVVLSPGIGDDSARIQSAIDAVSSLPLNADGFRGAVLLTAGDYSVDSTLYIKSSGVVIRGDGSQAFGGTRITCTATNQMSLFEVDNIGSSPSEVNGTRVDITDAYVPVGAKRFNVADASGFSVGDTVMIQNMMNEQWIKDLSDMSQWGWTNTEYQLKFRRTIFAIDGNQITVDAPVVQAIETQYGGGVLYRYSFEDATENIGFEGLRLESTYVSEDDEDHGWRAIRLRDVKNGWIRQVTGLYFGFGVVDISSTSHQITVEDCAMLDPKSKTSGGRKYSFNIDDSECVLMQRCFTRGGRHDFVSGSRTPGPNVFVDCHSTDTLEDIGPHQRYSIGQLYDCIKGGAMNVQNRKWSGTGHGWSGAQIMFWNCDATSIICDSPTGAVNWVVGSTGTKTNPTRAPEEPYGIWDSHEVRVTPRSLYYTQLAERLGFNGLREVILPEQEEGTIWAELEHWGGDGLFLDGLVAWQKTAFPEAEQPVVIDGNMRNLYMMDRGYTSLWQKVSGPGSVHFDDASLLGTTAMFSMPGTYVLQLSASTEQSDNVFSKLLMDDFEDDTIGALPMHAQDISPTTPADDHAMVIVGDDENRVGSGKALRLMDNNASKSTRVGFDFVGSTDAQLSAVRVDLNFAPVATTNSGDRFALSVGAYDVNQTSGSTRFLDCRMNADGTLDIRSSLGPDSYGNTLLDTGNALSIFMNDRDAETLFYTGADGSENILQTNSVAYWLNGSLILETLMENRTTASGTIFTSENNLGRFGFASITSDWGLDYVIDDLEISTDFNVTSSEGQTIDNFETYVAGDSPTRASDIAPGAASDDYAMEVVGEENNIAGSGNALRLFDNNTSGSTRIGYDLTGSAEGQLAAAHIQFSFAPLATYSSGDRYAVGIGEYGVNQASGSTRFLDCRLKADGTIDFKSTLGPDSTGHSLLTSNNTLNIYVNDYDSTPIDYTGPDSTTYSLQTNSVAYWLNGILVLETLMENRSTANGTLFSSENNIGRISFASITGDWGLDYVVDNLTFSSLGEVAVRGVETALLTIDVEGEPSIESLYNAWVSLYPELGGYTNLADDVDADGLNNLVEYALGGDPTIYDVSVLPTSQLLSHDGENWLYYIYTRREDAASRGLSYTVLSGTDLSNGSVTNEVLPYGISAPMDGVESITNRIRTDIEQQQFIGLEIEMNR